MGEGAIRLLFEQAHEDGQDQLLGFRLLHIENDGGGECPGEIQERPQASRDGAVAGLRIDGIELRIEGRDLDRQLHAGQRAEMVPLKQ